MKYLIVGLGNIGEDYNFTRHNVGFDIVDLLAQKLEVKFMQDRYAYITEAKYRGRTLILLKPTTYMNLSGKALKYWKDHYNIPIDKIMVITDDLSIDLGKIRIRGKGSDGGHNGLKSINQELNSTLYPRLRFGIGSNFPKGKQAEYVLSKWNADEIETVIQTQTKAAEAVLSFITIGLEKTMNQFNN